MIREDDLRSIVYRSAVDSELETVALSKILATAREVNNRLGVTGLLLKIGQTFFQVFEGQEEGAAEVFERISRSRFHHDIHIFSDSKATTRLFPEWAMASEGETTARWVSICERRLALKSTEFTKEQHQIPNLIKQLIGSAK